MKTGFCAVALLAMLTCLFCPRPASAEDKGTFWELLDKSELRVISDPWPAVAGPAKLKVTIDLNDDGKPFAGTLEYRVSAIEKSTAAWKPMPKLRTDKDGNTYFEAPITLVKGANYIQFRVHPRGEEAMTVEPWKLDVP